MAPHATASPFSLSRFAQLALCYFYEQIYLFDVIAKIVNEHPAITSTDSCPDNLRIETAFIQNLPCLR
jgi:hypothetical protein